LTHSFVTNVHDVHKMKTTISPTDNAHCNRPRWAEHDYLQKVHNKIQLTATYTS